MKPDTVSVKLGQVKSIRKTEIQKLQRAGVKSAEELALIDLQRHQIAGVSGTRLRTLRKEAQLSIFRGALTRVRSAADGALEGLDAALDKATKATIHAASLAQERAQAAIDASRGQARVLARVAASNAHQASRRAQREYAGVLRKLRAAPPRVRSRLKPYESQARRAAEAAELASQHASEALRQLRKEGERRVKKAAKRGKSLLARMRVMMGRNGPD